MTRRRSTAGPAPAGAGPVPHFTPNEMALLQGVAAGDTYNLVAIRLGISENAADMTAGRVMRKLKAHTITHAVYLACQLGVLDVRGPNSKTSEVHIGPSLRLLRSLVAEGFSVSFIAERMGMGQPELSVLMSRVFITPTMEKRVAQTFAELAGRDPLVLGVHPRGVTRARNRARAEGWEIVPPEAVRHVA
ncbi:helix-turn-helix transcriptional regulator [Streptomyces sp. NPDC058700]|uniref:helix-turn-helix domain-containing protein n=1 Tax=Streptomyces sp. NPDC058700 TaxID=3346607 RepID=UPI003653E404